jgi:hypothetical protein
VPARSTYSPAIWPRLLIAAGRVWLAPGGCLFS